MSKNYNVGDKFIIEIDSGYWNPKIGNRYLIKGFRTLCFDDEGLSRLEKYEPKTDLPKCQECVYSDISGDRYPCSMCYRGDPREEQFIPKGSIISGKK